MDLSFSLLSDFATRAVLKMSKLLASVWMSYVSLRQLPCLLVGEDNGVLCEEH